MGRQAPQTRSEKGKTSWQREFSILCRAQRPSLVPVDSNLNEQSLPTCIYANRTHLMFIRETTGPIFNVKLNSVSCHTSLDPTPLSWSRTNHIIFLPLLEEVFLLQCPSNCNYLLPGCESQKDGICVSLKAASHSSDRQMHFAPVDKDWAEGSPFLLQWLRLGSYTWHDPRHGWRQHHKGFILPWAHGGPCF